MSKTHISIRGARVNNLKNIDVDIPRDQFVVLTGLSGSGKSSLAFDTIYAEGYRRFVESLSSYARQFLGQLDKPDLDSIDGLSPAISIDQKTTSRNPRSTVGTVTEIYDYLRLLYARVGVPHCPVCGREIKPQAVDHIIEKIMELPAKTRFQVMSPVVRGKKGLHEKIFADTLADGYVRARVDGVVCELSNPPELEKNKKHNIDIIIDRLVMQNDVHTRLAESVESALKLSEGWVVVELVDTQENLSFSTNYACEVHGISMGELAPRMFSFNNPFGACPDCDGLGIKRAFSPHKLIPNPSLSLAQGAIQCNGFKSINEGGWSERIYTMVGNRHGFTVDMPIQAYSPDAFQALMYGTGNEEYEIKFVDHKERVRSHFMTFEGIIPSIKRRYNESNNVYYELFMEETDCALCQGKRLNKESLAVTVGDINIAQFCALSVDDALKFINELHLSEKETLIAIEILKEIKERLSFLERVGLSYLSLSRRSGTLSGGEAQRIRLATQIGSSLMGVLYILDEPSIGLHQRDNDKLIASLKRLRDVGNTVIVVEHDHDTIQNADFIVDIGPGAGVHGGQVVVAGTPQEVMACKASVTGQYLSGKKQIPIPQKRRIGNGNVLSVLGASHHNLKNIDVHFPLGTFICVTGVSGSGKSSLIIGILYPALASRLNRANTYPGKHKKMEGVEHLDKVIDIDQSPIGRTPRSNPATYTGLFSEIRDLFARTNDAKVRGYKPGRFSFNVRGGRCEACEGDGTIKIEMHFLPDVYVTCDVCKGKRYNRETLEVKYKGKNISDVLKMTVEEGLHFFENIPSINRKLQTLYDVGLGYIKIGQSSTTLSGGEAQRVKLATELSRRDTGKTIYILDEPTTGLHAADVAKLTEVLQRLVDAGNTVLIIEHNLDIIKTADYIVDLGPEGGDKGGTVLACGTPEEIARDPKSYTGQYLKETLDKGV
ncbi:MAG TPA: excinuclease ABC subunit UvrA [Clostridiales bacterium]|nr:excinuclease ABC subunit UvrA [Clostridiales bacterium]